MASKKGQNKYVSKTLKAVRKTNPKKRVKK
jgi:hypothetical protein